MRIREAETVSPNAWHYEVKSQLQRFVYARSAEAFAEGDAARDALATPDDVRARQERMRDAFIANLGGLPASDTPLNARTVGTVQCQGYTIEKVIFESRPGVFVTANLYLPEGMEGPRGAVLFVCGHSYEAKAYPRYQDVCQCLVRAGLIVLAQDPVGQGERLGYHEPALDETTVAWGTTEHDYAGSQCLPLGDAIGRYFLHDAMRGIDYLQSRPEVDPDRIGVTGNSGGGTQSSMLMVCEPRLIAAAPATFVTSRETYMYSGGAQDAEQIWPGMSALGFDHEDILLGMAPKPVLVLAVQYDFFPIEGTRRTVQRARRVWELLGKGEDIGLVEDTCQHQYSPKLARAAAAFFSRHLLGRSVSGDDAPTEPLPPQELQCTSSGQVRGELPGARFVYEENLDRLTEMERARDAATDAARRKSALSWLREQVFRHRRPCDLNPREYATGQIEELAATWYMWWPQEGLFNNAAMFRHWRHAGEALPVTIALWAGGTTNLRPHQQWIRSACEAGRAVMVLDPSGVGPLAPFTTGDPQAAFGVIHKLNDDLAWLGDSLTGLRTYDVTRAVDVLEHLPLLRSDEVTLYGQGRYAVYGQLAAAIDERIGGIEVVHGMGSYAEWVRDRHFDVHDIRSVILPGMLRHFDLPDLARWAAGA